MPEKETASLALVSELSLATRRGALRGAGRLCPLQLTVPRVRYSLIE